MKSSCVTMAMYFYMLLGVTGKVLGLGAILCQCHIFFTSVSNYGSLFYLMPSRFPYPAQ